MCVFDLYFYSFSGIIKFIGFVCNIFYTKKLCISNAKTKLCNLSTNDDMNRNIGAATIGIARSLSRLSSKSVNVTAGEDFIPA